MKTSFVNRVALVTGASQGLGEGIAVALAEAGAAVGVHHAPSAERAAGQVVDRIIDLGGRAVAIGGDLRDPSAPAEIVQTLLGRLDRIDILVNNAGATTESSVATMTIEEWGATIAVNLTAVFLLAQAVLPAMTAPGLGPDHFDQFQYRASRCGKSRPLCGGEGRRDGLYALPGPRSRTFRRDRHRRRARTDRHPNVSELLTCSSKGAAGGNSAESAGRHR